MLFFIFIHNGDYDQRRSPTVKPGSFILRRAETLTKIKSSQI